MRKTKIICTLGPSTDKEGVLRDLIANGMNVARFNFSHGSHEEHLGRFEKLKALREEMGYNYEIEMDGSTNKAHWKMISDANPDVYVIGRSGLFGLTDNIESSCNQMVSEYEECTGFQFDNGLYTTAK